MANFVFTPTQTQGSRNNIPEIEFISWSPYPQPTTKTTELINRIGSTETIVQTLFESSRPTQATAVAFSTSKSGVDTINENMSAAVGLTGSLKDNINQFTMTNLVFVDLHTQIKKVGEGWIIICTFTQFVKVKQ